VHVETLYSNRIVDSQLNQRSGVYFGCRKSLPSKLTKSSQKMINNFKRAGAPQLKRPISWAIKRTLDFSIAAVASVLTLPVVAISAIAVKMDSKGPALFKQVRLGMDGKPFTVFKLRTMEHKLRGKKKITRVGKFLRKHSIDEFPQFWNMLKGDMSVVGPRPVQAKEAKSVLKIDPDNAVRYAVLPGAKLDYNSFKAQDLNDRIYTENDYVLNWSPKRDIQIFFRIAKDVIVGNNG
jgi:lipopolysaccharide/colanic/teichoic acid biosynthesis glycosyltransferase